MPLVVCPGIHPPPLTDNFLAALDRKSPVQVIPAQRIPVYSPLHVLAFLESTFPVSTALILLGFSAGVVGSFGAALAWQGLGGKVTALIAVDGWGVPLFANFPIHRLSHDPFTHWSGRVLGGNAESFYADPGVAHLDLWRSPDLALGWRSENADQKISAAAFLKQLLDQLEQQESRALAKPFL
jgi:hypothetical protein